MFIEDYYSRGDFFNRANIKPYASPNGAGYSVDVSLKWLLGNRTKLEVEVKDLLGSIWWEQAPYTKAQVNPVAKTYDSQGYVHYIPALSGIESFKNYRQKLRKRFVSNIEYAWSDDLAISGNWMHTQYLDLVDVAAHWKPGSALTYSMGYGLETGAVMAGIEGTHGGFAFAADTLDFDQAHSLSMNIWLRLEL